MGGVVIKSPTRTTFRPARNADPARATESGAISGIRTVKIPVRCPHCDIQQLCEYPEPVVVMALTRWNNMNLYVPCHDGYWSASRDELQAIRQYLGEAWIESRAQSSLRQPPRLRIVV
jgi:hypothetical protein